VAHTPEDCKNVFPTWRWLVGILFSLMLGIVSIVLAYENREREQEHEIITNRRDIQDVKRVLSVIEDRLIADMDTLKREARMLRGRR
jgi:membrane protein implicated in regulation of membrane protease activity